MTSSFVHEMGTSESTQSKPRVCISTDIGGADADDIQSLVHVMYYLDEVDLKCVVASPSADSDRTPEQGMAEIHSVYEAYAADYANLSTWGDYPTPESLYSISYPGAPLTLEEGGTYSQNSPGADVIGLEAQAASPDDKLHVLTWGSPTDVALALDRYGPEIADSLVVYTIIGDSGANSDEIAMDRIKSFDDLLLVDNGRTFRGMYAWDSPTYGTPYTFPSDFVEHDHETGQKRNSALAQHYMEATERVHLDILKMGDTPSFLYVIDSADNNDPTLASSWGGEFVLKSGNHYVDRQDTPATPAGRSKPINGAGTVSRHADAFLGDWVSRLNYTESQKTNAIEDDFSTDEDTAVSENLISNDTGENLVITQANDQAVGSQITLDSGALLTVNADGAFDYNPNSQFEFLNSGETTTDSFTYTVSDGLGTDTTTVTLTIEGLTDNTTPVAEDDFATTNEDTAVTGNVLTNDTDPENDALTVTTVNGQAVGSQITLDSGALLTVNADGTFDYNPNSQFEFLNSGETTTDSFTYTVSDSSETDTGMVAVTIDGVYDAPTPTPGDDDLLLTAAGETIDALAGDDIIRAAGGPDNVFGNDGNDELLGHGGNDTLNGGADNDFLNGDAGDDELIGDVGNDRLNGSIGDDRILGGSGDDVLLGADGMDTLNGGDDADKLYGGNDADELNGEVGKDVLLGQAGNDTLKGGVDHDLLRGGVAEDSLVGGSGNDRLFGESDNDILIGVNPDSSNPGEGERDILDGGSGSDLFVLGTSSSRFYDDDDHTTAAAGNISRVLIRDFEKEIDQIQLHGVAEDYWFREINGNTQIFYEPSSTAEKRDLIGIVKGTVGIEATDYSFV
ncbi:MAG: nucleoside hydrolase-like domain-containing protein [Microcoleaceae cyanobacterium]